MRASQKSTHLDDVLAFPAMLCDDVIARQICALGGNGRVMNRNHPPTWTPHRHQLAAREKLRDNVALHQSLHEKKCLRSPRLRNSYTELYLMNSQAIIKKKEEMVRA
ncbi:hypothetical protein TNIN_42521 [Trichonephila inaurata madagascariensis]|uniref:Uncharacterized protein n=1 Tax=Trichonephila inaurata madagascariensis TaxID=2747483 RepID=A0A8X6XVN9_9ARAC|nr:hypothetical protein TNIN_42521 [Trichonephila inaurata madagascariensis]